MHLCIASSLLTVRKVFKIFRGVIQRYNLDDELIGESNTLAQSTNKGGRSELFMIVTEVICPPGDISTATGMKLPGSLSSSNCYTQTNYIDLGGGGGDGSPSYSYGTPFGGGGSGGAASASAPIAQDVTPTYKLCNGVKVLASAPCTAKSPVVVIDDETPVEMVAEMLQTNPSLLIKLPCAQLQKWQSVSSFKPPQAVVDKINTLKQNYPTAAALFTGNFGIQYLQNASGTVVNMDYFPVTVSQLPTINGQQQTASQFLEYIRQNLNSFVDPQYSDFSPYNAVSTGVNETSLWNSSNPVTAIIHIEIPFDEGSVICSDYAQNHWRFTTISAPGDKTHPVSGTREFGYETNPDGSYTFYTRGVDRITQSINELFGESKTFNGADKLWNSFQDKIQSFVSQNGGTSVKIEPTKGRPNWSEVGDVLNGIKPVSSLGCK